MASSMLAKCLRSGLHFLLMLMAVFILVNLLVMKTSSVSWNPLQRGQSTEASKSTGSETAGEPPVPDERPGSSQSPEDKVQSTARPGNDKLLILFWTPYWIWDHFGMGVGQRGFVQAGCGHFNCFTSTNKKRLREATAIMFHGQEMPHDEHELTMLKSFRQERRKEGSMTPLYIYFMKEPANSNNHLNQPVFKDFFDLTFTFRSDSNITAPYGSFWPTHPESESVWPEWRDFDASLVPGHILHQDLSAKIKDVAWIVSHCQTDSRREEVVAQLESLTSLKIDVYGKCGSQALSVPDMPLESKYQKQSMAQLNTYRSLLTPYKFYLSFENTLCKEYITEKFFYALAHPEGPIPIAFGGWNMSDYAKVAPPHSYLFVEQHESLTDLVRAMEYLSQNQTAYNEYFWWRQYYALKTEWDHHQKGQCDLCALLKHILSQDDDHLRVHLNSSLDIAQFWNSRQQCRTVTEPV